QGHRRLLWRRAPGRADEGRGQLAHGRADAHRRRDAEEAVIRIVDEDYPARSVVVSRAPVENRDVRIDLRQLLDAPTNYMNLSKQKVRELITALERMIEDEEN